MSYRLYGLCCCLPKYLEYLIQILYMYKEFVEDILHNHPENISVFWAYLFISVICVFLHCVQIRNLYGGTE